MSLEDNKGRVVIRWGVTVLASVVALMVVLSTLDVSDADARKKRKKRKHSARIALSAPAPPSSSGYSDMITITEGGTYSGNWESNDPNLPAVLVDTTEPVVIENCNVRGKGDLISTRIGPVDVTVRDCNGYGLNPQVSGRAKGRFFKSEGFKNVRIHNNYLDGTAGIYLLSYQGKGTSAETVKIERNKVKNIDGRHSAGPGGGYSQTGFDLVQFVQFDKVRDLIGGEIAWNEVLNEPSNSRVEDNINMYLSSGTPQSPIRIHDNYIKGAYPSRPETDGYTGGGIMVADGSAATAREATHHVVAQDNQVIDTTNHGIAIASGYDNKFYDNRIVSDSLTDSGIRPAAQNIGSYVWDIYGDNARGTFYNNYAYNNTIGWVNKSERYAENGYRNDGWFPDCAQDSSKASLCTGNQALPAPITSDTKAVELDLWRDKLAKAREG